MKWKDGTLVAMTFVSRASCLLTYLALLLRFHFYEVLVRFNAENA